MSCRAISEKRCEYINAYLYPPESHAWDLSRYACSSAHTPLGRFTLPAAQPKSLELASLKSCMCFSIVYMLVVSSPGRRVNYGGQVSCSIAKGISFPPSPPCVCGPLLYMRPFMTPSRSLASLREVWRR